MRKVDDKDIPVFDLTVLPVNEGGAEADGFDKFAYVDNPAIEEMGIYLEKVVDKRILIDEVTEEIIIEYLSNNGREGIPDNWTEKTEEEYNEIASKTSILQLTRDPMSRESWNDITDPDEQGQWLIRYEYDGPKDSKNRNFCRRILNLNRIYTEEEIKNGLNNPEFGNYSIWDYKGSYGCRHRWRRKVYFESYEEGDVERKRYVPNFVKSRLNDSDATRYNSLLSTNVCLENSEKQQVVAPLLIPNKKIYREDKNGEYYIRFSELSIKQIRDKADEDGKLEDLNIGKLTHKGDIAPAFILEEWIIEDENDKAYTKFNFNKEKVPVGSWMVITQITDKEFWKEEIVKKKRYAYSIEAFLNMKLVNLNINKNNIENMEDKEKTEMETLREELQAAKDELSKLKEHSDEEVEAKEDKAKTDEEEVEVEVKAKEGEEAKEAKSDEEVEAQEDKSEEDKEKETVEAQEEEEVEETKSEDEEVKDEEVSDKSDDDKFEAIYDEIATIKSMISEMGDKKEKVEMSSHKKGDLTSSLAALSKIMNKNKLG